MPSFLNFSTLKNSGCLFFILFPFLSFAQQSATHVSGKIVDAGTGHPLSYISIGFTGSKYGTSSDDQGNFSLSAPGQFSRVTFSYVGYQSIVKTIIPGQMNELQIRLQKSQTQLNEVKITSAKKTKYRNKGNPAVELIQQVIDHKKQNRMESADYVQYDQYERIGLSFFDIPAGLMNNFLFKKFKFMLDTTPNVYGLKPPILPAYFNEKFSQVYYRKDPKKLIQQLNAQKGVNIIKFIDTAGLDIYLNRMYGNNIDIYENNIFIVSNQFLSPIADHSPDYYKFFISDTIQIDGKKLVELSFTPRNKGDLLFEGKLAVTLDGRYAVQSCELNVVKQININFIRSMKITLDFQPHPDNKYYLIKSDVKADFGISKTKGFGVFGERTVFFSNYKLNAPQPAPFYDGKELQTTPNFRLQDSTYWLSHRTDTLTAKQNEVYDKVHKLEKMPAYKTETDLAYALTGGYVPSLGNKLELGPIGAIYSYNSQEGSRIQVGGRTTPQFNKSIYLQGYAGYGFGDHILKYDAAAYFSLNKTQFWRFPNDYFKVSYLYDLGVPGDNFEINNNQQALSSFHSGKTDYWLYNKIFKFEYVKDFESHFSYNLGFKNWDQQAAGTLQFQYNDPGGAFVRNLTVSEIDLGLRYAPHEKLLQGTESRHTIHSKYPIYNLQINQGFKGLVNGSYSYTNIGATIYKRFYMSQLGYADVKLLGSYLIGKVPFPLLNISPANQSIAYDPDSYNKMDYLEFVSDHYVGINFTQSFNGFFLNKIPLIEHLKWREYLSFKALYGGLRNENNPDVSNNLYLFPVGTGGANGTYALGHTPYLEAGAGIGNIFKVFRFDLIRRFNYLDHPDVSKYGIKFSFGFDF